MGAKRVFFRAGQISVLQKILNETPADKLPWVMSRLRLALANRRMAVIATEEAEVRIRSKGYTPLRPRCFVAPCHTSR